jgi:hypothetical protein
VISLPLIGGEAMTGHEGRQMASKKHAIRMALFRLGM